MSTHTPGPWQIAQDNATIITDKFDSIASSVVYGWPSEETRANARLIAAAPDLLKACKLALGHIDEGHRHYKDIAAAIAKATIK